MNTSKVRVRVRVRVYGITVRVRVRISMPASHTQRTFPARCLFSTRICKHMKGINSEPGYYLARIGSHLTTLRASKIDTKNICHRFGINFIKVKNFFLVRSEEIILNLIARQTKTIYLTS